MPFAYLIDTDCVIEHFRRPGHASKRLQELWLLGLGLSIISLAELWEGVHYSRNATESRAQLGEFLNLVTLVPVTEDVCRRFGELRGQLRKRGRPLADFDLLIAARALELNLTLLSNNRRHFEQIEGLRLESLAI